MRQACCSFTAEQRSIHHHADLPWPTFLQGMNCAQGLLYSCMQLKIVDVFGKLFGQTGDADMGAALTWDVACRQTTRRCGWRRSSARSAPPQRMLARHGSLAGSSRCPTSPHGPDQWEYLGSRHQASASFKCTALCCFWFPCVISCRSLNPLTLGPSAHQQVQGLRSLSLHLDPPQGYDGCLPSCMCPLCRSRKAG